MSAVPAKIAALVDARDGEACVRCGDRGVEFSRHHRKLRSRRGKDVASNLILLCGSGTTGCHGWAHSNVEEATRACYIVASWHVPAEVPVLMRRLGVRPWTTHVWCLLDDAGNELHLLDEDAHELLVKFGIWKVGEVA